jgi:hypothetical protein
MEERHFAHRNYLRHAAQSTQLIGVQNSIAVVLALSSMIGDRQRSS